MKLFITLAALALAGFIGWKIFQEWEAVNGGSSTQGAEPAPVQVDGRSLEGMDPALEPRLEQSIRRGADGLRDFLALYRKTIRDPRLAWIELDYVVLVARHDLPEARRVFARVKKRTPESSPVFPRIKQLENTYD